MSKNNNFTGVSYSPDYPRYAQASACGKAIIVGEHAVVYGSKAVAMPLKQLRMKVEMTPILKQEGDDRISLMLSGKEVSPRVSDIFKDGIAFFNRKPFALKAKGSSSVPIGAGLGSSATLSIVILKLLSKSLNVDLDRKDLAYYGNQLEKRFHGNPSGLDTSVVAFEQCILFQKGSNPVGIPSCPEVSEKQPLTFALIDSGMRASTLAMIRLAEPFFKGTDGDKRLAKFDELADAVQEGLLTRDAQSVAEAMNECGVLLHHAGIVSSGLMNMIEFCQSIGTLGVKSTGAGGGGAIMALLDPARTEEQLRTLVQEFGQKSVFQITI